LRYFDMKREDMKKVLVKKTEQHLGFFICKKLLIKTIDFKKTSLLSSLMFEIDQKKHYVHLIKITQELQSIELLQF